MVGPWAKCSLNNYGIRESVTVCGAVYFRFGLTKSVGAELVVC